jgi:RHS repeat-associated protein
LAGVLVLLSDGTYEYIYGLGSAPVAQVDSATGVVTFLHGDLVGSTRSATDASGVQVGSWDYSTFGVTTTATGGATGDGAGVTRFLFAGEYLDDSGLYYLRARFYDPVPASFLSVDPALAQTGSPYAYAAGNPLQLVDPLGLNPWDNWTNSIKNTVKSLTNWDAVGDIMGSVDCKVFGGFFGTSKAFIGGTWAIASNDWGDTLTFIANNVNPINSIATGGSIAYAKSHGGVCVFSKSNMMYVCGDADWGARGGTTLGATFISSKPLNEILPDTDLLGHEEVHSTHEAILGLPVFGAMYFWEEADRALKGAMTPDKGDWGEGCNMWEELAGLKEGHYDECRTDK